MDFFLYLGYLGFIGCLFILSFILLAVVSIECAGEVKGLDHEWD